MERTDLWYWALGAGGVAVVHYLANRRQGLSGAAMHAAATAAQEALPQMRHPMMQACIKQVAAHANPQSPRVIAHGAKPPNVSDPKPRVIDVDFTVIDEEAT